MSINKYMEFKATYDKLSHNSQIIIRNLIHDLPKLSLDAATNKAVFKYIKEMRDEKGFTYTTLYEAIKKELNNTLEKKSYEKFLRRNSVKSVCYEPCIKVLDIKQNEIDAVCKNVDYQYRYDIFYQYTILPVKSADAVNRCAQTLLLSEQHPNHSLD